MCEGTGLCEGDADPTGRSVGICGGGIGGLALALALQHRGIAATVYERDESFWSRPPGYALTMQQGGKALRALGLWEEVRDAGMWTETHRSFDGFSGEMLGRHGGRRDDIAAPRKKNKQNYAVHVPRQAVRALLCSQLLPGTIRWNSSIASVSSSPSPVVTTRSGDSIEYDVVVGADGIRSACRRSLVANDEPLRESGIVVVLGRSLKLADEERFGDVFEIVDGSARVYAMPYDERHTMWQLSWPSSSLGKCPKEDALGVVERWRNTFPEIYDLVESTPDDRVTGYPIYDRDDLESLPSRLPIENNVALIGDAAHPMCPFKAQGANQALLDAVDLARALHGTTDTRTALEVYNALMIPRALTKVLSSRDASYLLHSPNARARSGQGVTRAAAAAKQRQQNSGLRGETPLE